MLFRKPHCTLSPCIGTGGRFSHPTRDGDERWGSFANAQLFSEARNSFLWPFCVARVLCSARAGGFPCTLALGALPGNPSVTATPPSASPCNQKSYRVFLHPPRCTFLVVMCLSVPLSTIQTFPLFLSFGIFFYFSPCRVLGFEGLGTAPGSSSTAAGWALSPFPRGFGRALGGLRGRSVQWSQAPRETLTTTSTICPPT